MSFITCGLNFNNRSVQTLNTFQEFEGRKVSIKYKFYCIFGTVLSVFLNNKSKINK